MVSLNHMLLRKTIFTSALFATIFTSLHPAADDKKGILANLTRNVEQEYLDDLPYRKRTTYFFNGTLVGYIYYGASRKRQSFGRIDTLRIQREFRFQGIGSYILKQAMQDLKYDGYKEIRLEAVPLDANRKEYSAALEKLIMFYEKHGFKVLDLNTTKAVMEASLLSDTLLLS